MSRIIAGRFDRTLDADAALDALRREGFTAQEIDDFYVSPPGQNAAAASGGDAPHSSEGSKRAGVGAMVGAGIGAAVGIAAGLAISQDYGVVAILLGGGLGAYIGSFAGAMSKVRAGRSSKASIEHPVEPRGGRMLAVNVDRPGSEQRALAVLKQRGARDVGRAEGDWRDGSWRDFDPRAPLATM
jgi:hypothetical protein